MTLIAPKQVRAFLDRWKMVRESGADELRNSSMETRMRQLSALVGSRRLFNVDADRERRVTEVRERWARIRKALRAPLDQADNDPVVRPIPNQGCGGRRDLIVGQPGPQIFANLREIPPAQGRIERHRFNGGH
jgi:hypothetical protein